MRWLVIVFLTVMVHLVRYKTMAIHPLDETSNQERRTIDDVTIDESRLRCSVYFSSLYTHRQLTNFFGQVSVSVLLDENASIKLDCLRRMLIWRNTHGIKRPVLKSCAM
jgi:hypothetical protein